MTGSSDPVGLVSPQPALASAAPPLGCCVVVPTTRPGVLVAHLLPSLARCVPAPTEVIVVLDGVSGEVPAAAGSVPIRALRLPHRSGPAAARNAGVAAATAPVVLFLDDDVLVPHDVFARVRGLLAQEDTVAATGTFAQITGPGAGNFCSLYKNDYMGYVTGERPGPTSTLLTAVCAVRRAAFVAVGGFDVKFADATVEDIELGQRLARGGRVAYDPSLAVVHLKRYTPWGLIASHWRRSRDMARLLLAKPLRARLAELGHSHDALSLPAGFGAGVGLVAVALASPLLYLSGLTPVAAAGAGALAMWAALAVNLSFLRFLARRRGAAYALAGGSILVCELAISVLASSVATLGFPLRRRRVR